MFWAKWYRGPVGIAKSENVGKDYHYVLGWLNFIERYILSKLLQVQSKNFWSVGELIPTNMHSSSKPIIYLFTSKQTYN